MRKLRFWWCALIRWCAYCEWPRSRKAALPKMTRAERVALMSALADHPGWHYLMAKLENQKSACEAQRAALTYRIAPTAAAETLVRELIRLDEAIFRIGLIQATIERAGAMPILTEASDADPATY